MTSTNGHSEDYYLVPLKKNLKLEEKRRKFNTTRERRTRTVDDNEERRKKELSRREWDSSGLISSIYTARTTHNSGYIVGQSSQRVVVVACITFFSSFLLLLLSLSPCRSLTLARLALDVVVGFYTAEESEKERIDDGEEKGTAPKSWRTSAAARTVVLRGSRTRSQPGRV